MKKTVFFVDLQGYLGDYVKIIRRESKTADVNIQDLQTKLNATIKVASRLQATAENCKNLWERLVNIVYSTNVQNKEDKAYKEIINGLDKIGYSIAYVCPRVGMIKPFGSVGRREKYIGLVKNITVDFRGNKLVYTGNELLKKFMEIYLWHISNDKEEYEEENLYRPLEEFYKGAVVYQKGILNHFKENIPERYNSKVIDEEETENFKVVSNL